jgi:hypothetical protein
MLQEYVSSVLGVPEGMLQVLYIDVAKVHRDVAHIVMAIHVCFKYMIKCFICSRHMLQVFCLNIAKVDLDVAYTCYKHIYVLSVSYVCSQVFHLDVAYVCIGFQVFSSAFVSVLDTCFKCFICLLLYVATVASGYFKSRSGVAHGMRVGSG